MQRFLPGLSKLLAAAGVAVLAACAGGESFDYVPSTEIKEGPGLFSGEDGVIVIYRK